jgi:hypothetical protein
VTQSRQRQLFDVLAVLLDDRTGIFHLDVRTLTLKALHSACTPQALHTIAQGCSRQRELPWVTMPIRTVTLEALHTPSPNNTLQLPRRNRQVPLLAGPAVFCNQYLAANPMTVVTSMPS